jgi:G3E family GTPase
LRKRRDRFDYILIETTGLADPGPVAQTFFVDEDLREDFQLDAIVALIDAAHIDGQLASVAAAADQVGFADVLLLNKTDLVADQDLARVERSLRAINATARIVRTRHAELPLAEVLDLGAFDLDRALSLDSEFLEPQQFFEWAGSYSLGAGAHEVHTGHGGHDAHEHEHEHDHDHAHSHAGLKEVSVLVLAAPMPGMAGITAGIEAAARQFAQPAAAVAPGGIIASGSHQRLQLGAHAHFSLEVASAGEWLVFLEHAPAEFGWELSGKAPQAAREYGSHHHDSGIASIGIADPRPLDAGKVNDWLSYLLQSRGQDILRMKGVLSFRGETRRYVFHGVHMIFDGRLERPWGEAARMNRLVFIGRDLDRNEFEAGFESCVA